MTRDLVVTTPAGLYCPPGDFYIDPARPVDFAVITHAHADHARRGVRQVLAAREGLGVLRERIGASAITAVPFGQSVSRGPVRISLHPAGHILGSAQVRLEFQGEVWVVSGDYKLEPDPTCGLFEPQPCHTFVTESTFGNPEFRWPEPADELAAIHAWWRFNQRREQASVLFAHALGKSQRLLASLDPSLGPIFLHERIAGLCRHYSFAGVHLARGHAVRNSDDRRFLAQGLVLVPPARRADPWLRRFEPYATACVSGWMLVPGESTRQGYDRGFVISDHADWLGLTAATLATTAERVLVTHGDSEPLAQWLRGQGKESSVMGVV